VEIIFYNAPRNDVKINKLPDPFLLQCFEILYSRPDFGSFDDLSIYNSVNADVIDLYISFSFRLSVSRPRMLSNGLIHLTRFDVWYDSYCSGHGAIGRRFPESGAVIVN
jgi:hypothetical protein